MASVGTKLAPAPKLVAPDVRDFFYAERVLALVLIAIVALWLRAQNPGQTTAYMDESIYVVYGRMFLAKHFEAPLDSPLRWSFGWYLWPILSTLADRIGGIIAIREMSALMGTGAIMAIYGFARRLYGDVVGLGTAAVFAVLGPAVMVSRIATRDAGSFCFFAFGLWAFARAWQKNEIRSWLISAICLFCAFLCKYLVAIYFPFLVLIALRKGWRPAVAFCVPMVAASGFYLGRYWSDLAYLLQYGNAYGSLRAHGSQLLSVYVTQRIELWVVAALALLAFAVSGRRAVTSLLWLGALTGLAVQWKMRADFDFWKHVTYTLVFLTPMAVYALIAASKRFGKTQVAQTMIAITTVLLLASGSAWAGKSTVADRVTFWPNVEPIISYFEGRLPNNARILTDDSVLRYYFNPLLSQSQIVDPFYVNYKGVQGSGAYSRAVEDGAFDYVILDGGMGAEAQAMHSALWGHMGSYTRVLKTLDPSLGREIDIFQRTTPPAALLSNTNPSVEITAPATESQVASKGAMSGKTAGAGNGWYVRLEVLTDRWYSLGKHPLRSDGTFQTEVNFAGEGYQACHHMLRARLYDAGGNPRAVSVVFNLKRADTPCQ